MININTLKVPGGVILRAIQEGGSLMIEGMVDGRDFIDLVGKKFELAPGMEGIITEYRLEVDVINTGNGRMPGRMIGTFRAVNA